MFHAMHKAAVGFVLIAALGLTTMGCDQPASKDQSAALAAATLLPPVEGDSAFGTSSANATYYLTYPVTYGNTSGSDRGDCLTLCTKGNYNANFKRDLCYAGKTPGVGSTYWFRGHFTYKSVKWDKMGTGQDHQGVCVTRPPNAATGVYLFHDGCTGFPDGNPRKMTKGPNSGWTPANWGQAFHAACVVHDLCYKAEPNFSNKSKQYCDDQMEKYAREICYASYGTGGGGWFKKNDIDKCLAEAGNARYWLKVGEPKNNAHYTGFNYSFDWRPYYYKTTNGIRRKVSGICGSGQFYDVNKKDCVNSPTPTCTGGRIYSSYNGGSCYCQSGKTWNGSSCVCPSGTFWNGGYCVPSGTYY